MFIISMFEPISHDPRMNIHPHTNQSHTGEGLAGQHPADSCGRGTSVRNHEFLHGKMASVG